MSFEITGVSAQEILDSRGRPTLQTTLTLSDETTAAAGVPSGASTGTREAVELRDRDPTRFGGWGVLTAAGAPTTPNCPTGWAEAERHPLATILLAFTVCGPRRLVAHDAVNRLVLSSLDPSLGPADDIGQGITCWNLLSYRNGSWRVERINHEPLEVCGIGGAKVS